MIAEIDFSARLLSSTIRISTLNRTLVFHARSGSRLRTILNYTQQRVMDIRQPHLAQQFRQTPNYQAHASVVGGLAMQKSARQNLNVNPYTRVPMLMRRKTLPKFY